MFFFSNLFVYVFVHIYVNIHFLGIGSYGFSLNSLSFSLSWTVSLLLGGIAFSYANGDRRAKNLKGKISRFELDLMFSRKLHS